MPDFVRWDPGYRLPPERIEAHFDASYLAVRAPPAEILEARVAAIFTPVLEPIGGYEDPLGFAIHYRPTAVARMYGDRQRAILLWDSGRGSVTNGSRKFFWQDPYPQLLPREWNGIEFFLVRNWDSRRDFASRDFEFYDRELPQDERVKLLPLYADASRDRNYIPSPHLKGVATF